MKNTGDKKLEKFSYFHTNLYIKFGMNIGVIAKSYSNRNTRIILKLTVFYEERKVHIKLICIKCT